MKKIIITVILCLGVIIPSMAQGIEGKADPTVTKRGIALLPQAGDFALGIEATPFFEYLGGFMGGNSNWSPDFEGFNQTIYGKYFLEDNVAVRAKIRLNFGQTKNKTNVQDDYVAVLDPTNVAANVFDTRTNINNNVDIRLGYELRRGKGRVQGFYGGELYVEFDKSKRKFDYANPITESNQNPSTAATGWDEFNSPTSSQLGYRVLERNNGTTLGAGLGGFVGVEYFFTPQISIGGELSLGFIYSIKGQDEYTTEGFLDSKVQEFQYRSRTSGDEAFATGLQTRTAGSIFVLFHF